MAGAAQICSATSSSSTSNVESGRVGSCSSQGEFSQVRSSSPHSYLAVPPLPGSLWLFPGSVPHAVLQCMPPETTVPATPPPSGAVALQCSSARISIAINFLDATPPPPCKMGRAAYAAECLANMGRTMNR